MKKRIIVATLIGTFLWIIAITAICSQESCNLSSNQLPAILGSLLMFITVSNALLVGVSSMIAYLIKFTVNATTPSIPQFNNHEHIQPQEPASNITVSMRKYSNLFIFYYLIINTVIAILLYFADYNAPSTMLVIAIVSSCLAAKNYFKDCKTNATTSQIASYSKLSIVYVMAIQIVAAIFIFGYSNQIHLLISKESIYLYGVLLVLTIFQYFVIRISFSWYLKKLVSG